MDIDQAKLDFAKRTTERIIAAGNYPAKVEATLYRERPSPALMSCSVPSWPAIRSSGSTTSRSPPATASIPILATPAALQASSARCAPSR